MRALSRLEAARLVDALEIAAIAVATVQRGSVAESRATAHLRDARENVMAHLQGTATSTPATPPAGSTQDDR